MNMNSKSVSVISTGNLKIEKYKEKCRTTNYSLCNEEDNKIHILLKCNETQKWKVTSLNDEWRYINK